MKVSWTTLDLCRYMSLGIYVAVSSIRLATQSTEPDMCASFPTLLPTSAMKVNTQICALVDRDLQTGLSKNMCAKTRHKVNHV